MLAFINHFIISTVEFLNRFIANCETKFVEFDAKLQHVESSLIIIESKLASVPDSFVESAGKRSTKENNDTAATVTVGVETGKDTTDEPETKTIETEAATEPKGVKVSEDERYKKYFKMLQFGVPAPAVKLKMAADGLDGSLLE